MPLRALAPAGLCALLLASAVACGGPSMDETLPGIYILDRAALRSAAYDRRASEMAEGLAQATPKERRVIERELIAAARHESRASSLRLELRTDGRFGASYRYGKEEGASAGTWAVHGDRVRLTTTHEQGRALEQPYEQEARVDGQRLFLEGKGVPRPFALVRVPPAAAG